MTQEQKELLLKDICARLPYRPEIWFVESNRKDRLQSVWYDDLEGWQVDGDYLSAPIYAVKPYLFPMLSMTDEQKNEYHELVGGMFGTGVLINFEFLEDFFYRNHLDYRGLIPMGLAEDATGKKHLLNELDYEIQKGR